MAHEETPQPPVAHDAEFPADINAIVPPEQDDPDQDSEKDRRKYRASRRKARDRAGEIKELNITAMMDMMTILLVFLIKSYTASSTNVSMTDKLQIPKSSTLIQPQDSIAVAITLGDVSVNEKPVAKIVNGLIPAEYHEGGTAANPMVEALYDALGKEVDKQKFIAQHNPGQPFTGRVNIVADKRIPYQTLLAVLYTAGRAELGQYKLMAIKTSD